VVLVWVTHMKISLHLTVNNNNNNNNNITTTTTGPSQQVSVVLRRAIDTSQNQHWNQLT